MYRIRNKSPYHLQNQGVGAEPLLDPFKRKFHFMYILPKKPNKDNKPYNEKLSIYIGFEGEYIYDLIFSSAHSVNVFIFFSPVSSCPFLGTYFPY